jgi:hypothetical protein
MEYLQNSDSSMSEIRYEELAANQFQSTQDFIQHLSLPMNNSFASEMHHSEQVKKVNEYQGPLSIKTRTAAWRLGYRLSPVKKSFAFIKSNV